jgi:NDP-sugar pyrophosphorylase family protein
MIWIFPLAGRGTRTQTQGGFKPFIKVGDKRLIEWTLLGVKKHFKITDSLLFITTEEFERKYSFRNEMQKTLGALSEQAQFFFCKENTHGPAQTIYEARRFFDTESPCTIVNGDQFTVFDIKENLKPDEGFIPIYFGLSQKSSFVQIDEGLITEVVEKKMISHYACAGAYGIGSGKALINCLHDELTNGQLVGGEHYVGPSFNFLIQKGSKIYPTKTYAKFDLGDVESIDFFKSAFSWT